MNLILTSDFPVTPNAKVVSALQAQGTEPRIAWIPPHTEGSAEAFAIAKQQFGALGLNAVECLDIDEDRDEVQIAYLHEFDVVFLSAGDAVRFRYNAIRSGLSGRLRQCAAAGRVIAAAGGGALLLTPNVSVMRLEDETVDAVLATRGRLDALGAVDYEMLPHRDRWAEHVRERVRAYSAVIDHDVVALADGSAIFHMNGAPPATDGNLTRYRKGTIIEP